jgi:hypothetical protein
LREAKRCRPDVALRLAHKTPEQGADIERHGGPTSLVAEGLRELGFAAAGRQNALRFSRPPDHD